MTASAEPIVEWSQDKMVEALAENPPIVAYDVLSDLNPSYED